MGTLSRVCNLPILSYAGREMIAAKNKAQRWVFEGIKEIRNRLSLPILGFDSDNGSEFINDELIRYYIIS